MCRKTPPKHDATTPMPHRSYGVLGMVLIILLPPNTVSGIMTKKSDYMPFSHDSSRSSKWSLANLRWAMLTCAGLSRRTFRAMHDFKP